MRMFEMKSLSWGVWLIQKRERGNCKPYLLHYCIYAIYCLKEFPAIMHLFITLKILCQVYLTFKTYWEVTIFSPKIGITWVSALILSISKKKKMNVDLILIQLNDFLLDMSEKVHFTASVTLT